MVQYLANLCLGSSVFRKHNVLAECFSVCREATDDGRKAREFQAGEGEVMRVLQCLRPRLCRPKVLVSAVVAAALLYGALLMNGMQPNAKKPRWMEVNSCSPRANIAFLKTHKCASSAVQNILFRYGDKHDLNFALPDRDSYLGIVGFTFNAGMMLSSPLNKLTPNIFAIHTKWDHAEVKKVMPQDTVFFTIVREPKAVFESLYIYGQFQTSTGLTIDQYVTQMAVNGTRIAGYLGYNQMTWDFGIPREDLNNLTAVRELVREADDHFGLVMVSDRMEESLVLLAQYLCWELSDVLVLSFNSLSKEYKTGVSAETRQTLQQKLAPDYLLYRHFLARLDQQVEAFGRDRMAAEVARLREMMALLVNTCNFVSKKATQLSGTQRPWSSKVDGYEGDGGEGCKVYTHPELSYINLLRNRQYKRIAKK
ncbi:Galactose-3-O-sulfotransferase 3 [Chionoecetes opilio]|uniref:Galactose-3-O-sulfotransferase 3 n=1 Tax=Chionoecetes opilio TaxID=41210 RepID=A0A8J5CQ63_CHIOP|nr:Galactose-3-O-sulfotransferase 3 [Chionoecetes opilio]